MKIDLDNLTVEALMNDRVYEKVTMAMNVRGTKAIEILFPNPGIGSDYDEIMNIAIGSLAVCRLYRTLRDEDQERWKLVERMEDILERMEEDD